VIRAARGRRQPPTALPPTALPPTALPPTALLLPACLAAAVALLPLVYLVVRAFSGGLGEVLDVLLRERTFWLVLRSLALVACVTAGCLVIGIGLAFLLVRTMFPARALTRVLATLPLAIPSYVAAFTWLAAFPGFHGFPAAVVVLTLCCYPYVMLPVMASLAGSDPAVEDVARSLGDSRWRAFRRVTLPEIWPAAAAGGLLVALYVLSDFGAVAILRYDAFTRVIYMSYRSSFDPTAAAVLSCLLVALTVLIVWGENRSRGRVGHARLGAGAARRRTLAALGLWLAPAVAAVAALLAAALVFPLASLAYWTARGASRGLEPADLVSAGAATLAVSALGAAATILLAVPVGVIAARFRDRTGRTIEQAAYAGHALPGIVVALSLVYFGVRYAYPLYQRTPLLVLSYVVLFLPLAVGAVRASVAQSPPILEDVARSLGRSPLGALREVTVRVAAPGVAAGAVLVFLTCMKELPATLLLRPTGMDTLATQLWGATAVGQYGRAAPYAAVLVILAALPALVLGWRRDRLGSGGGG
jgi:iron(III) transport system permease protein